MLTLLTQLTNEINWHMRERGLSRADLAARMGVSPGRVSQILGGGENLTLRTLAALSTALDARFDIQLGTLKAEDAFSGRDTADAEAARVIASAHPGRDVIAVPCRPLIWQNGSLHCMTMQLPQGVLG